MLGMIILSNISADFLCHYTKSVDTVISIIQNGFYPRVSKEDVSFRYPLFEKFILGIPMVCFTDIPETLSEEHKSIYGAYGLGLKKEWGIKNGLNPVCYVIKNSQLIDSFNDVQVELQKLSSNNMTNQIRALEVTMSFGGFLKLYSEKLPDGSEKLYYDEKEWRYLPPFMDNNRTCNVLQNEYLSEDRIHKLNIKMKKYSLKFTSEDLEKIILPESKYEEFKFKIMNSSIIEPKKYIDKIKCV